jgi:signal transduction histidine kinase
MTLTNRILLFYLGSVAAVLVGFSIALYPVAQGYLYRQADERLESALNTLGAAVEIASDGVEWEPKGRALRFGLGPDQIVWVLTDGTGKVVARSERPGSNELLAEAAGRFRGPEDATRRLHWRGERWQVGQRWFVPQATAPLDDKPPGPNEVKYAALVVTAALPLDPTRAVLHQLLAVLVAISLAVLVIALAAGRFVCRRALSPVRQMAGDARAVDPSNPARRLVTPGGGDELTDLGRAFNGLLDRLHESAKRHRRFAGDASHQLRTPLAALLGQIEVALRRDRSADEYRHALTTAQAKATHLRRIVDALLFLMRAEAGTGMPRREPFDLAGWLPDHLQEWAHHPRFSDIRVARSDSPVPVLNHPILLGEVVNVLLDNACRYSDLGSPITVSLAHAHGSVRIEVADRGRGIAAGDLPQVFTPFFRTADALRANKKGVGLGLSIARRLTESLGGVLSVTSRHGEGSQFVVSLPTMAAGSPKPIDCEPVCSG